MRMRLKHIDMEGSMATETLFLTVQIRNETDSCFKQKLNYQVFNETLACVNIKVPIRHVTVLFEISIIPRILYILKA